MAPVASAHMKACNVSEVERIEQKIARLEGKRDTAGDELSRRYYVQCIAGWRAQLKKLLAGAV